MTTLPPGLVHTPVTPFTADEGIDYGLYGKILAFHIDQGAEALALPMHAGESVSLTDDERRALLRFALREVRGRVPVMAHVSQSGTGVAAGLARDAATAGAAAVVATTPYYWTPPPAMLLEHFTQIGAAAGVPFYVYNSPAEMGGVKVTTDLALKLLERLDNFAGLIDASLDWQFMIDLVSNAQRLRPPFALLTGAEYPISARAIGAKGMMAPLAGIAPGAVRRLWALCRDERYEEALPLQEALAALRQAVKPWGVAGLKAGMGCLGRECGQPRPPIDACAGADRERLAGAIGAIGLLKEEPRGW